MSVSSAPRRIVIVGGVAAGSSCATRARRLDESSQITVFEKGAHVSFANCGLPYHVGGVIPDESSLLLVSPERFKERFNIDVRIRCEVVAIDADAKRVHILDHNTGQRYDEPYDSLVLAPGAATFMPPVPGLRLPGVFTMRTVPDTRKVRQWLKDSDAKRAVVVGAGFIGLEVAENLHNLGLDVHVVEMAPQVLPSIDADMAGLVQETLENHDIHVHTGVAMKSIEARDDGALDVHIGDTKLTGDIVILGLGVRPRTKMAVEAGVAVGELGGLVVDAQMRTNVPDIYAVGDVTEEMCAVTGLQTTMPLAGPANRQGRMAADAIMGRSVKFRGVQGTAVCGLFGTTVATTGLGERKAKKAGVSYGIARLHPSNHVSYYPGSSTIHLKVLFDKADGRVIGGSAFGTEGVDKRIDVLAMAIQMGATVFDLEQAELCYAPQFGAAKDPVNQAGMIGSNAMRGDLPAADWTEIGRDNVVLVDVRELEEWDSGHLPGAIHLPLSGLRDHLDRLPEDVELLVYCRSGKRSYDAVRALVQRGFNARSLSGGLLSWSGAVEA